MSECVDCGNTVYGQARCGNCMWLFMNKSQPAPLPAAGPREDFASVVALFHEAQRLRRDNAAMRAVLATALRYCDEEKDGVKLATEAAAALLDLRNCLHILTKYPQLFLQP